MCSNCTRRPPLSLILTLLIVFGMGGLIPLPAAFAQDEPVARPSCPNTPAPRLHIGGEAVVAPGLGPLNMRALPAVSTGVEVQLYGGNRLTVVGGPSCNGGYTWWRVENVNGRRGWIAEGDWEGYFLLPARDYDRLVANPNARAITPLEATCPAWRPRVCPVP